ncbi:hypothetical protein [Rhodococcus marinonascens]|uniref:hypothetical protein n=1 Tax=Rhodococcus marinonascens TaxID=38311 RepID=UPI00093213C7|nr:hypothetical protein [Rhodococcus marinonascens]
MAIKWTESALKHGIDIEDAKYAIAHAEYMETEFDEPRPPSTIRPTLFIGPRRRPGAPWLEVMVEIGGRDVTIFHVMEARKKHLERMED